MSNKKSKCKRIKNYHFCVNDEEAELIHQRMVTVGFINRAAYIRRMAIKGYCINIDLTDVREMVRLLRSYTNNLNQLRSRAREVGSIYEADIKELQDKLNQLWGMVNGILSSLAKIK